MRVLTIMGQGAPRLFEKGSAKKWCALMCRDYRRACSIWYGGGRGNPVLTVGFEPLARVTLYRTNQKESMRLFFCFWGSSAKHSILQIFMLQNQNSTKALEIAKERGGVACASDPEHHCQKSAPEVTPLHYSLDRRPQ